MAKLVLVFLLTTLIVGALSQGTGIPGFENGFIDQIQKSIVAAITQLIESANLPLDRKLQALQILNSVNAGITGCRATNTNFLAIITCITQLQINAQTQISTLIFAPGNA